MKFNMLACRHLKRTNDKHHQPSHLITSSWGAARRGRVANARRPKNVMKTKNEDKKTLPPPERA
jgi:hypothetical protein